MLPSNSDSSSPCPRPAPSSDPTSRRSPSHDASSSPVASSPVRASKRRRQTARRSKRPPPPGIGAFPFDTTTSSSSSSSPIHNAYSSPDFWEALARVLGRDGLPNQQQLPNQQRQPNQHQRDPTSTQPNKRSKTSPTNTAQSASTSTSQSSRSTAATTATTASANNANPNPNNNQANVVRQQPVAPQSATAPSVVAPPPSATTSVPSNTTQGARPPQNSNLNTAQSAPAAPPPRNTAVTALPPPQPIQPSRTNPAAMSQMQANVRPTTTQASSNISNNPPPVSNRPAAPTNTAANPSLHRGILTETDYLELNSLIGQIRYNTSIQEAFSNRRMLGNLYVGQLKAVIHYLARQKNIHIPTHGIKYMLVERVADALGIPPLMNTQSFRPANFPRPPAAVTTQSTPHVPIRSMPVSEALFSRLMSRIQQATGKTLRSLGSLSYAVQLKNNSHMTLNFSLDFNLSTDVVQKLKTDKKKYRVFMYTMQLASHFVLRSGFYRTQVSSVRVDGVPLNNQICKNDNLDYLDITDYLSAAEDRKHNCTISVNSAYLRDAVLCVMLCEHVTIEDIIRNLYIKALAKENVDHQSELPLQSLVKIYADHICAKDSTEFINRPDDNDEDDVLVGDQVMQMLCPLSMLRVQYPVKSTQCSTHQQYFDLGFFLQAYQNGGKWTCPICHVAIRLEQLEIDRFGTYLLNKFPNATSVVLRLDGTIVDVEADKRTPSVEVKETGGTISIGEESDDDDDVESYGGLKLSETIVIDDNDRPDPVVICID